MRLSILGFAGAMAFAFTGASTADAQQPKRGGNAAIRNQRRDPALRLPRQRHLRDAAFRRAVLFDAAAVQPRQVPRHRGRSRAVLDGRARPQDLHLQAASGREIPRRHAAHLGRRQGDLRPAARPAGRRGVDPQGHLRRYRYDRDARPDHRHLQDEVGERRDDRALRLAVELHLRRQGHRGRPERAEDQDQRHRAHSPSSSTSRAATSPARRTTAISSRACPISTASRASSCCRPPPCSTPCRAAR